MKTKEIIGYKLKNEKYRKAAKEITEMSNFFDENEILVEDYCFDSYSHASGKLDEYKVLDLWFEPVYKEPELEVGKWYKNNERELACPTDKKFGYGFNEFGKWSQGAMWGFHKYCYEWKPATEREVEKALTKEAKKRGLWEVPIIQADEGHEGVIEGEYGAVFDAEDNTLWSSYGVVFYQGKWAEIIKEQRPTKEDIIKQIEKLKEQINLL